MHLSTPLSDSAIRLTLTRLLSGLPLDPPESESVLERPQRQAGVREQMAEGRELTPLPTLAPVPRRVVEEYCRESFSTSSSSAAAAGAQQHAIARLGIGVGVGVGAAFTRDSSSASASASSRHSPSSWRDSSSSPMSASACMSVSVRESYFDDDLAAVGPVCLGALPRDDDGLGGSLEDSSQCCSNATFSTAPTASASASASGSGAGAGAGAGSGSGRPLSRSFAGVELDDLADEERSRAVGRRDRELSVSCASASASASAGSRGHEAHADAAEGCERDHCSALEYSLSFDLRAFHALPADESYSERDGCDDEAFSSPPMETESESQTPTQTLPTRTRLPRDAESGISNPTDATLSPTAAVAVDDEATSAHPCHKSSCNTCNCNPEQCQSRSAVAPAPEAEPEASAGADTDTQASRVVLPEFEMSRVYRLVFAPSRTSLTISTPFHPSQATITDEIQFESASASAMGSSRCLRHSLLSKSLDFLSVPSRSAAAATTASERSACRRSLSAPQLKRLPHSLLLSSTQSPAASQSTQPPPPPPADTEMPIPSEPSPVPAHSIEPKPEPELERALPHFLLHESIYEDRCHNNTDRTVPYEEHSMLDTDTDADYDYTRVTCATLPLVRRRRSSRSVAGAVAVAPPTSSAISCAPRPLSCCSASSETRRTMPDLSFLCRLPAASASGSGARSPRRKWSASASPAPGAPSLQHRSSHQLLTVSEPPAVRVLPCCVATC